MTDRVDGWLSSDRRAMTLLNPLDAASTGSTILVMTAAGESDVKLQLRLTGVRDERSELASLRQWLSRERAVRVRVSSGDAQPVPGEMGAVTDVLVAAVASGGAISVLLSSLQTWLQARRPEVSVEVTKQDGSKVSITASGSATSAAIDAFRESL